MGLEAWGGADAVAGNWSTYGGLTAALFGDVRDDGWRLRSTVGYGMSRYRRGYFDSTTKQNVQLDITSHRWSADLLLGYQHTAGPLTIKAFAGIVQDSRSDQTQKGAPIAYDDESGWQGEKLGARLVVETWTRLADWGFLQIDAGWSTPRSAYSGRTRLGYRLEPAWSVGLEAAAFGDPHRDAGRIGTFVRYEWTGGEVSLSSGTGMDKHGVEGKDGIYGSFNALFRF